MKKKILNAFYFCLISFSFYGQQAAKLPELSSIAHVKKGQVIIRWAPGKEDFWEMGNQYGYKVERFLFEDFLNNKTDTAINKKAVLLTSVPLKPWIQADEKWTALIKKNKNAVLLFNFLYKQSTATNSSNKNIIFGMVLKSCDLFPEIAKANGLFLIDSSFTENEIYVYRISFWNVPKTIKYTPALLTVNTKEKNKLENIKPIKAKFSNRKALITIVAINTENDYSGFWIERSLDSINFITVNKAPLIHTTTKFDKNKTESIYADSLSQNNKTYYYRVRGISYFGDLSEPSNIVSGKGKVDFTEYPIIDSTNIIHNKIVRLKFRMPEKFDVTQLKYYSVLRSETKNGKYTNITPVTLALKTIDFTDEQPLQVNYYKICAVNLNNDSTFSFTTYAKLIDDVPPTIPNGLVGKIDSSGAVTLSWNSNTETDFLGYRVYRCNTIKEQPVEITKTLLTNSKITDKLNLQTLTKEIYYTIRAVDRTYNNSGYSIFCKIIKPDKIAPVSPVFKQVIYSDSSIQLNWHISTSNDATNYKLLKVDQFENGWKIIKEWRSKDSLKKFADTAIIIGSRYKYRIEVYDEAKNSSFANSPSILFKPAFAPKIKTFIATINLEKRNITLSWNYNTSNIYTYSIYKAKGNESFRVFKTVTSNVINFIDTELYPNNIYHYTIKATLISGIESKMSDALEVNF